MIVQLATVTWPLDREHGRWAQGLTDFKMDQNFLESFLHLESRIKKCFLALRMLFTITILFLKVLNLLSLVLGVAFLIASPRKTVHVLQCPCKFPY